MTPFQYCLFTRGIIFIFGNCQIFAIFSRYLASNLLTLQSRGAISQLGPLTTAQLYIQENLESPLALNALTMCTMAMGTGRSYHDSYCNLGMKYQFSSFEFTDGTMLTHSFVCYFMKQNRDNLRGQNITLKCSLMIRTFKRDFN